MEVNFLTKRNIQPKMSFSHSEQSGYDVKKRSVKKAEYNNGPTKDVSFRGSAVLKAANATSDVAKDIINDSKIPKYAKWLVNKERFVNQKWLQGDERAKKGIIGATLENEALIEAAIVLGLTTTLKPLCTLIMPGASKEDKEVLATKHALSGLVGFAFSHLVYSPIAKAANKISKDPTKYIKNSGDLTKKLEQGGKFHEAFDVLWKKGPDVIMSIPKSALTVALITPTLALLFPNHKKAQKGKQTKEQKQSADIISQKISNDKALTFKGRQANNNNDISFTGLKFDDIKQAYSNTKFAKFINKTSDKLAEWIAKNTIGKVASTKPVRKISEKLTKVSKPQALMSNLASVVLTLSLLNNTAKSDKIEKDRKPYLLLNTALVTLVSSTASVIVDHASDGFLNSMKKAYMSEKLNIKTSEDIRNALKQLKEIEENGKVLEGTKEVLDEAKRMELNKFMRGVNKLKSHTIFSFIVRFASPLLVVPLTTKMLDLIQKYSKKKKENNNQPENKSNVAQSQSQPQTTTQTTTQPQTTTQTTTQPQTQSQQPQVKQTQRVTK